ncbi:MAG: hypothetical protein LDLANPLL_00209 [Turneriella sp.]|nr:hypothetical protein [Turneriella sp.]
MDEENLKRELEALKAKEAKVRASIKTDDNVFSKSARGTPKTMRYTWLGVEFAVSFLVFVYLGSLLDNRLNASPWFTLAGLMLGFSIAIYRLLVAAKRLSE